MPLPCVLLLSLLTKTAPFPCGLSEEEGETVPLPRVLPLSLLTKTAPFPCGLSEEEDLAPGTFSDHTPITHEVSTQNTVFRLHVHCLSLVCTPRFDQGLLRCCSAGCSWRM